MDKELAQFKVEKDIFIHVGLPKCGSTFLQRRIFLNLDGVFYFEKDKSLASLIHKLPRFNPLIINLDDLKKRIATIVKNIKEEKLLISYEGLFSPLDVFYYGNCYTTLLVTKWLSQLFPNAKIILIIRRQDDFLESLYRQSLRPGHSYSQGINKFLRYKNGHFNSFGNVIGHGISVDVRVLDYYKIYKNYLDFFGSDNILVIPYELLKFDSKTFIDKLCFYIGTRSFYPEYENKEHKSHSFPAAFLAFIFNRFFIRPHSNGRGIIPKGFLFKLYTRFLNLINRLSIMSRNFIDTEKSKLIMNIHMKSNKKLDELLGLNLKDYGYY